MLRGCVSCCPSTGEPTLYWEACTCWESVKWGHCLGFPHNRSLQNDFTCQTTVAVKGEGSNQGEKTSQASAGCPRRPPSLLL